ncbi:MAG TPA: hypothetical protein ENI17_12225 [Pseudomonas xinjiangensis]|uniref:Uncharacterized protein n=2 Tax=root TaxID=1 RepID=A0A7V1BQL4_9GAMM|nr:hypothetical protein [Halopseudomonas xinjiangensis]HEC48378.1 hypothetical protein [Halopseudomonas xinjiangensis]
MDIQREAVPAGPAVMSALQKYPVEQANTFLMTRAAEMEDACVGSELAELASALHLLAEGADPGEELQSIMDQTRSAIFSHARWGLKQRYLDLPTDLKSDLEKYDIFQRPFNSLLIRESLESGTADLVP